MAQGVTISNFVCENGSSFASGAGGTGVYVNNAGTFTMKGGTISGNKALYGGGVAVEGSLSLFEMAGTFAGPTLQYYGVISGNSGSGVYVGTDGSFYLRAGIVYGTGSANANTCVGIGSNALFLSGTATSPTPPFTYVPNGTAMYGTPASPGDPLPYGQISGGLGCGTTITRTN
jgi:hypothetical protein